MSPRVPGSFSPLSLIHVHISSQIQREERGATRGCNMDMSTVWWMSGSKELGLKAGTHWKHEGSDSWSQTEALAATRCSDPFHRLSVRFVYLEMRYKISYTTVYSVHTLFIYLIVCFHWLLYILQGVFWLFEIAAVNLLNGVQDVCLRWSRSADAVKSQGKKPDLIWDTGSFDRYIQVHL